MATKYPVKFSKSVRTAVAKSSDGLPDLGTWLKRITDLNDPALTEAVEGIWTGWAGSARIDIPESNSMLCVGWYRKKVEWSYLS